MNAIVAPTRYKFSVDDYHKLMDSGIFHPEARIELIDGELIEMPKIGGPHAWAVANLIRILARGIRDDMFLWCQSPLTLRPFSEPQPDVMLLRQRPTGYKRELPEAADALLIIEVADSSLSFDRNTKKRLYARYRVQEYWIVNVNKEVFEIYTQPSEESYLEKRIARRDETISPICQPDLSIALVDVFDQK